MPCSRRRSRPTTSGAFSTRENPVVTGDPPRCEARHTVDSRADRRTGLPFQGEESMRITGLGHAGMFIETAGGTILCDPWVKPAFFGSWFPFPDNRGLDWEKFGKADFLYVSHRHADHFDPRLLREFVPTTTRVLLPEYPTTDLEDDLRTLGYTDVVFTRAGEPFELDGLRMMITPLLGPGDGP